jgi:hypothetical protein
MGTSLTVSDREFFTARLRDTFEYILSVDRDLHSLMLSLLSLIVVQKKEDQANFSGKN